ncbi:MAG: DUF3021 domain-containing protein [Mogibacterium sp.]|nr:DUF3021 domain-containing protein [Mogibacterium sp.]
MIRKTLKRTGLGFLIGTNVGNIIAFISVMGHGPIVSAALIASAGSESGAMLIQTLLSGVLGAVAFAGMSFYEIEYWGMLKTMAAHFAVIVAVFVPIALCLGWAETSKDLLIMVLIEAAAYLVIWVIMNERYKAEVRKLNQLIENKDTRKKE